MKAVTFAVLIVSLLVVLVAAQPQRLHHNGAIQQHKSPYEGGDDQQHMGRPESDEGSNGDYSINIYTFVSARFKCCQFF